MFNSPSGRYTGSAIFISVPLLWDAADVCNGLMAIPNIFAVLLLSKVIADETKKYAGEHIDDVDTTELPVLANSKKGVLG